jgi:hypothetical protein
MRNLKVELYVIERATVLFPGGVITSEFRADTIFHTPFAISISRSSTMEEIEREPIMQVQAESPTFQDAAEIFGIIATILRRNESITIRHVYISDADSPRPMSVPKGSKALLRFEMFG